MERDAREEIRISNEKGIVEKRGAAFHSPLDFAKENLFYVVWSNRYICNNLYSVSREYLEYYSLIWVLEGQMEVTYEGRTFVVGTNEAVLLDFRKPHSYRTCGSRLDKWEMVFGGNASAAYYSLITGQWGNRFRLTGRLQKDLRRLMEELEAPIPADHRISMLLHGIFCEIVEQNRAALSPPIEKAVDFIEANYGRPLQVSEIADYAALSRHYFSRLFHKETGRSPIDYLADVRMNAAKEMLTEKALPVSEIAERCGFVNASHFSRFFREKTGQTPAAFRRTFDL